MYIFKPLADKDEISKLYGVTGDFAYIGYDGDEAIGGCTAVINGSCVTVTKMVFDEDKLEFGEGLIRSALNYAANRNAYMARCECENTESILKLMGFEKNKDGIYEGDIPTLLGGSCGGGCCNFV